MKIHSIFLLVFVMLMVSCKDSSDRRINEVPTELASPETIHPSFVSNMERAHNKKGLLEHDVICFNLDLTFGDNKSSQKITTATNSSAIRIDRVDGATTVMVDGDIYTDADSTKWNRERFGVFTYQYFFMAPYKFSDAGTKWEKLSPSAYNEITTDRAMLTFESGTGDAPDDWYIVHSHPRNSLVTHIGYIVTGGGTTREEAEKNAHAIVYSDYQVIKGIPIAHQWTFYKYDKELGLGEKIGDAVIKNVQLMDRVDQFEIIKDGTYTKINAK